MTQSNCILPMAMRVASQTIGNNLVSVQPLNSITSEKLNEIKSRTQIKNRDSKIDSIINNTHHIDLSIHDDEEYKLSMPGSQLFYLDYTYGTSK